VVTAHLGGTGKAPDCDLIGLFLNIDADAEGALLLTLLVGTPALTFIGMIGAAIAVTLRRGGLLLAIIVLPLTVPVLIFGVAAANAAVAGPVPFGRPFTVLCALTLGSLVVGPFAAAAALRQALREERWGDAVFAFIACWTEFFFALVLTSRNAFTLPTVFRAFLGFQGAQYGEASALAVVSLAPSIALGVLAQRHLVRGLTLGAVRG